MTGWSEDCGSACCWVLRGHPSVGLLSLAASVPGSSNARVCVWVVVVVGVWGVVVC